MKRLKNIVINTFLASVVLFTFHVMTEGMLEFINIGVSVIAHKLK
jgi:hypothetical protein